MLKEKIETFLKNHNFKNLSKILSGNLAKEVMITNTEQYTTNRIIEKFESHKLIAIRKRKEIIKREKIKQDEKFLEAEFRKNLAINQLELLKLEEENKQWHTLIDGIFDNNVKDISEVLKNYKGDINKNIKFILDDPGIDKEDNKRLLFYVQDEAEFLENVIVIETLSSILSPEQVIYLTPLALAIKLDATENLDICNLLKQYNPNPNISIINGVGKLHPLLHETITLSSKEKVRLLLELGANPDVVNNIGISSLTLAASESITENITEDIIDNLIEYGPNLDFRPNFDFSKSIDG